MQIDFACPSCQKPHSIPQSNTGKLACTGCGWEKEIGPAGAEDPPHGCLVCGCSDLWRRKDFPQKVGVAMVALASILSTIAWAYYLPGIALGVLLGFLLIDMIFYAVMPEVLVCYRCDTHYRKTQNPAKTEAFDLEIAERYRQEKIRLQQQQPSAR